MNTKADLNNFATKADLNDLKAELYKAMAIQTGVTVGLTVALVKLL